MNNLKENPLIAVSGSFLAALFFLALGVLTGAIACWGLAAFEMGSYLIHNNKHNSKHHELIGAIIAIAGAIVALYGLTVLILR